jgi:DNA-binding SARP family transcriptional activator
MAALGSGGRVGVSALVDGLWDGNPPESCIGLVRTYVSRLRSVLGTDAIRSVPGGYTMPLSVEQCDLWLF